MRVNSTLYINLSLIIYLYKFVLTFKSILQSNITDNLISA